MERVRQAGYTIRDYHYDPQRTVVIDVPVKEPFFRKGKRDVSIWEQAENTAKLQKYWADNAVSNTITFSEDERDQIEIVLQHYEDQLKSASFLPLTDHGYVDAPYEEIEDDDPEYPDSWMFAGKCLTKEEKYTMLIEPISELDFSGVIVEEGRLAAKEYCDSESCSLPGG